MPQATMPSTSEPPAKARPSRARRRGAVAVEVLERRFLLATAGASTNLLQLAAVDPSSGSATSAPEGATVVADEPTVHSNPATAQPVPEADQILIEGAVGPTQAPDMYRVTLGADTGALTVDLASPGSTTPAVRLWVFDASGQELGNFPLAPSSQLSVVLRPLDPSPGEPVYVAVSHDGTGPAADSGLYLLRITRLDDPSVATTAPILLAASPISPTLPSAAVPGSAFGAAFLDSAISESAGAAAPVGLGQGMGMGQGMASSPLPIRSAAPSGGLLAEGEAAPPLDLAADAVDRALFDLGSAGRSRPEIPQVFHVSRFEVLVTSRDAAPAAVRTAFYHAPTHAEPAASPTRADEVPSTESRDLAGLDVPFGAGLGVAALMGVGLVLPDVASVVESYRRRPRRIGWGARMLGKN